jgi:hypothetical protein
METSTQLQVLKHKPKKKPTTHMVSNLEIPRVTRLLASEFRTLCIAGIGGFAAKMGIRSARELTSGRGVPQLTRLSARIYTRRVENISMSRVQYHRLLDTLDYFDTWNKCKYARSFVQKQLHRVFIAACLDIVFRDTWETDQALAMAEAGVTEIQKKVAVAMGRRFGKTFALAELLAAMLVAMQESGVTITVYSSCLRASTNLLLVVKMFVNMISGLKNQVTIDNMEVIELRASSTSPKRKLTSLPCPSDVSATLTPTPTIIGLAAVRTHTHQRFSDGCTRS